jgi:hypothetical protein
MILPRVSTDDVAIVDLEGNRLAAVSVEMFERGDPVGDVPVPIYAAQTGAAEPSPDLLTDAHGIPRLNGTDEAWVDQISTDVVAAGAPVLRWEPLSADGARPAGPASGTGVSGEYPDQVIASGGGGGDVSAHAALKEGIHGIPTMLDGMGLLWDEPSNTWVQASLATLSDIEDELEVIPSTTAGGNRNVGASDLGACIDATAAVTLTIPGSLGALDNWFQAARIGTGVVTVQCAAGANNIQNPVTESEVNSVTILHRFGTLGFRQRVIGKWLVSGDIG